MAYRIFNDRMTMYLVGQLRSEKKKYANFFSHVWTVLHKISRIYTDALQIEPLRLA